MLTKQAIRKGISIEVEGSILTKDEVISLSENWNERQEQFFRKMLKQGGKFSLQGTEFRIIPLEAIYNNKGEIEVPLTDNEE